MNETGAALRRPRRAFSEHGPAPPHPHHDGGTLAGERRPADGPHVVLLHAGAANRRGSRDVAAELHGRGADVVAYDGRGFDETPAGTTPFRHTEDLRAVLDAIGPGPAWLVGNSQGGRIALDVALAASARVAGLVLIAPVRGEPASPVDELDPGTRRLAVHIDEADAAGDLDRINRLEVALWLDGPAGPEGPGAGRRASSRSTMNLRALRAEQPEDVGQGDENPWSRLAHVRPPTTIAWRALDLPLLRTRCAILAQRLSDVREAVELPGVTHPPALERPDLIADLIAAAVGLR